MARINKGRLLVVLAFLSTMLIALAPQAHASPDTIKSVDWTLQVVPSGNANYWNACVTLGNNKAASNLSYKFQYAAYTQTGTLDNNGCFVVTQTQVGSTFSYGTTYTLTAGASKPTVLFVSTTRTLGGNILSINKLALLLPAIGLVAIAAVAAVIGIGLYVTRKKN